MTRKKQELLQLSTDIICAKTRESQILSDTATEQRLEEASKKYMDKKNSQISVIVMQSPFLDNVNSFANNAEKI